MTALYPLTLFYATGVIFYYVDFVTAVMLFFGGILTWLCSYQALTGLIYAGGKKKILIPFLQIPVAIGGFYLLKKANFQLGIFSYNIDCVEFAWYSIVMGLLMAWTTRPDQAEIEQTS